jgi:hypothetical protein
VLSPPPPVRPWRAPACSSSWIRVGIIMLDTAVRALQSGRSGQRALIRLEAFTLRFDDPPGRPRPTSSPGPLDRRMWRTSRFPRNAPGCRRSSATSRSVSGRGQRPVRPAAGPAAARCAPPHRPAKAGIQPHDPPAVAGTPRHRYLACAARGAGGRPRWSSRRPDGDRSDHR